VTIIEAHAPVETDSGLFGEEPRVIVPFTVSVEQGGETQNQRLEMPLDTKLVGLMKQSLGDQATSAIRGLEQAILKGLQEPNWQVRKACADVLPAVHAAVPFGIAGDIPIPPKVEQKVEKIAKKVFEQTGARVVVTSAARTPLRQADAMKTKLDLGESPRSLYANKKAAGEIENAYRYAKKIGLAGKQVTGTMAMVIQRQIDSGVYISRHLREGAVDLRSRNLTHEQKVAVRKAAVAEGARVMLESTPPHFHLEVF
jgi:hypothetical protein